MNWRPDKVIQRILRETARAAAAEIRSSAPRVQHRDGSRPAGDVGGSFVTEVSRKDFIRETPWGGVMEWARLGQRIMWFVNGNKRQKARPVVLFPEPEAVRQALQDDAERYWADRASRVAP